MKRLLTLLALAGLSATAVACGDDSGDGESKPAEKDAGAQKDAAPPRDVQVTNVGAECTSVSDCKGPGQLQCLTELAMMDLPGGYCTAQCNYDSECGTNGACPVAALASNPLFSQFSSLLGGLLPQNCVEKCTVGDAGGQGTCSRSEHECRSLVPPELAAQAGALLSGLPALKQTYCIPPALIPDGGVGDAGALGAILGGLDAGL